MRHRILVVGRDAGLRARLARLLSAASYTVEIAESFAHARRIGLSGVGLSVVLPGGLGCDIGGLLDELRTATGRTVLVVKSSRNLVDPASNVLDAFDEARLLARIRDALEPAPKVDERPGYCALPITILTSRAKAFSSKQAKRSCSPGENIVCCANSCSGLARCCPEITFSNPYPDTTPRPTTAASTCRSSAYAAR